MQPVSKRDKVYRLFGIKENFKISICKKDKVKETNDMLDLDSLLA